MIPSSRTPSRMNLMVPSNRYGLGFKDLGFGGFRASSATRSISESKAEAVSRVRI